MMKGASEKQSDLIVITQECDTIVPFISPEGASSLRSQVSDLKSRVSVLSDSAREHINIVSDAIMQRYFFCCVIDLLAVPLTQHFHVGISDKICCTARAS